MKSYFFDKKEFLAAIENLKLLSSKDYNLIKFDLKDGKIDLSIRNDDLLIGDTIYLYGIEGNESFCINLNSLLKALESNKTNNFLSVKVTISINSIFIDGIEIEKVLTEFKEIDLGENIKLETFEIKHFLNNLHLKGLGLNLKSIKILEKLIKRQLKVKGNKYKEIGIYKHQNGFRLNINGLQLIYKTNAMKNKFKKINIIVPNDFFIREDHLESIHNTKNNLKKTYEKTNRIS